MLPTSSLLCVFTIHSLTLSSNAMQSTAKQYKDDCINSTRLKSIILQIVKISYEVKESWMAEDCSIDLG